MLSKPATMLLGLITQKPLNAYEIIKTLGYMNVKWWLNIADSTVYTTIKTLEKKDLITGTVQKDGNMPDKTVYTITEIGRRELLNTLRQSLLKVDYDTNIFTIAAFFIGLIEKSERTHLLEQRLVNLNHYLIGIDRQDSDAWETEVSSIHAANVRRMADLIEAEISGTRRLLEADRK